MTTIIKPILKYPGAKWNCAEWIISHFPAHKRYVEPYFGSGAVFFNKKPAAYEVINDLSGDVVNLFRVIREQGDRLAALVEMTPWAKEEYQQSYQICDDSLEQARRFVVRSWQTHGARIQRQKAVSWRRCSDSNEQCREWRSLPSRISAIVDRLRLTEIENDTALKIIGRNVAADTLIYLDPPYVWGTRNEKQYQHEMTDADHAVLLDALDQHPSPVVLSGYHCALYDNRLAHWTVKEKKVQAEKGNTRTEVLWLNPICVERLGYGPMFELTK